MTEMLFAEIKQLRKSRSASVLSFSLGESTEDAQSFFYKRWGLSSRKPVGGSIGARAATDRLYA